MPPIENLETQWMERMDWIWRRRFYQGQNNHRTGLSCLPIRALPDLTAYLTGLNRPREGAVGGIASDLDHWFRPVAYHANNFCFLWWGAEPDRTGPDRMVGKVHDE